MVAFGGAVNLKGDAGIFVSSRRICERTQFFHIIDLQRENGITRLCSQVLGLWGKLIVC
jgi:hypothetical protein